jgi:bacterial/archaeal transporter family-2 protein
VKGVTWLLLLFAFVAGAALPVQFSINAVLRGFVGGPAVAATISFFGGTLALIVVALALRESWPLGEAVARAPGWAWVGGLLGALFVLATIIVIPRLGAATTVGLILAGQVLASIVIDHFGLIRVPVHELNIPRLAGAVLIVIGVALVQRF